MEKTTLDRRTVLKRLVPLALLAVAPSRLWAEVASCRLPDDNTLREWLRPLADGNLGKKVGLHSKPGWAARFEGSCRETIAARYRQQARKDFAEGRVVSVDGWLLSETEALTHRFVYGDR